MCDKVLRVVGGVAWWPLVPFPVCVNIVQREVCLLAVVVVWLVCVASVRRLDNNPAGCVKACASGCVRL